MKEKVSKLLEMSIHVLKDCCLENGAIVAANTDKNYYCKDVFSYRYVWPRDAAFTLVAFDILGIEGYHEKYYNWILNRAEDFDKTNLLYQNYHSHGLMNFLITNSFDNDLNFFPRTCSDIKSNVNYCRCFFIISYFPSEYIRFI